MPGVKVVATNRKAGRDYHLEDRHEAGPPVLSADHPDYEEYMTRREVDGEVVIRRLIADAVEAFKVFK